MATQRKDNSEVSVFRFPDSDDILPENILQKKKSRQSGEQSWANLADAMQVLASPARPVAEPVYRRAILEQLEKPEPRVAPVVSSAQTDSAHIESSAVEFEGVQPEETGKEKDPANVQKVLDETFQKGLEQGRQEGRDALLQALREQAVQQGFSEGEQAGHEQGVRQGLQAAEVEVAQRVNALSELYRELRSQRRILDQKQVEQAAVLLEKLMLEILRVELRHSPEQIENLVTEAIQLLDVTDRETLKVRVHPRDSQWLQPLIESEHYPIRLLQDEQITPGGCRIEGSLGDVDATLETRLQAGIDHLRTLLLDDPEQMAAADLSVVTDELRNAQSRQKMEDSVRSPVVNKMPETDQRPVTNTPTTSDSSFDTANHLSESLTEKPLTEKPLVEKPLVEKPLVEKPAASDSSPFSFKPNANVDSALGAWDALGV